jgi:hypothetical protein
MNKYLKAYLRKRADALDIKEYELNYYDISKLTYDRLYNLMYSSSNPDALADRLLNDEKLSYDLKLSLLKFKLRDKLMNSNNLRNDLNQNELKTFEIIVNNSKVEEISFDIRDGVKDGDTYFELLSNEKKIELMDHYGPNDINIITNSLKKQKNKFFIYHYFNMYPF